MKRRGRDTHAGLDVLQQIARKPALNGEMLMADLRRHVEALMDIMVTRVGGTWHWSLDDESGFILISRDIGA